MKHICPDCSRIEDTEEAHCRLHIKAGQILDNAEAQLTKIWKSLRDGFGGEGQLRAQAVTTVLAYRDVGLLTSKEADLWSLRIQYRCPGHNDEGGRSWCAYCGKIP